uniref:Coiled-coil domain-containing protein 27 n=1 Tax=Erpetoichthys calabaricus TaxID=27687 RepID=A0A8C4T5P7_ERPCA
MEGIDLIMKPPEDSQRFPSRPRTACWHLRKTDCVPLLRGKSCTSRVLQHNQSIALVPINKDVHEVHSEKINLPFIEETLTKLPACSTEELPSNVNVALLPKSAWMHKPGSLHSSQNDFPNGPPTSCNSTASLKPQLHGVSGFKFLISQTRNDLTASNSAEEPTRRENLVNAGFTNQSQQNGEAGKMPWYLALLQEKEQSLLAMGEEINRLSIYETECSKLEGVTIALQNKVSELTHQLSLSENNEVIQDQEQLILQLQEEIRDLKNSEAETSRKDEFIAELREEIERLKEEATKWKMLSDCSNGIQNMRPVQNMVSNTWKTSPNLSTKTNLEDPVVKNAFPVEFEMVYADDVREFGEECLIDLETTNKKLMQQLEKLQKKYSISTGTVSSLKRELFRLESELQKCTLDRENLEKQLKGKQTQICSMAMKFSRLRDNRKNEDLAAELKKEWAVQTHQISELTQEVSRRNKMIGSFKAELHRLKQDMATLKYQNTNLQKEKVDIQNSAILLQHSESQAKVALEEIHSRFESFHNKIIQAVYGAPGTKPPAEEITDHEVLSIMQKIIEDRAEFHARLVKKGEKIPPLLTTEVPSKHSKPTSAKKR